MGVGGSDKPKRKISVGFLFPKELEGDTIYVRLIKTRRSKHLLELYVHSNETFKLIRRPEIETELIEHISGFYGCSKIEEVKTYLDMLKKYNDGIIEKMYLRDGLELTSRLGERMFTITSS